MPCILAIQADSTRRALLAALVRERVPGALTIVNSVQDAITSMAASVPDVVLVPTLLTPQDEQQLMAGIRSLDAPYVQTLAIPALEMLAAPRPEQTRRLSLRRRRTSPATRYEPDLVAVQINAGLERARIAREEHEWALAYPRTATDSGAPGIVIESGPAPAVASDERRRARRIVPAEVPWLSAVRMPWGLDLDLVNISSTGLLVGSGSKLTPGVTYEMQLQGPETALLVKARIVRSDVGRVDARGVRYYTAASFERALDVLAARDADGPIDPQQALAELLLQVVMENKRSQEPADVRFARGLRQLVRARDVLVRKAPITPNDGSESIYFRVPDAGRSETILQVLFDPDCALTEAEFKLLKAAAPMTAAVRELNRGGLLLPEAMPQVA